MIFAQADPADTSAIAQAHTNGKPSPPASRWHRQRPLRLAQAKAVAAVAEGTARNPGAADAIRFALILGLALIESMALYTFVIIFVKVL